MAPQFNFSLVTMRLLFSLVLLLTLTGCSPSSTPTQTLRLNTFTEPASLDPRLAEGMGASTVVLELYEGLVRWDPEGKPALALAENVEVSENGRHYTFALRPSKWSNGNPLTADDFVRCWKEALDPAFPAEYAYLLFELEGGQEAKTGAAPLDQVGVWSEGPHVLHVKLAHPAPYFLDLLTNPLYFPVHENPHVTNGPFKLVRWEHNSEILVEKNPHYWDASSVFLDRIHHTMIDSATTEITMFEQGELDWAGSPMSMLPYDALPTLREKYGVSVCGIDAVYWYHLNTNDPLLRSAKVRRALTYAINRQELAEKLAKGAQQPATGPIPSSLTPTTIDYLSGVSDQEIRALFQEGIAELGLTTNQIGPLKISTNICEDHLKLGQALQQRWQELLGIQVLLDISEWKVHLGKLAQGDYQIGRLGWYANFRDEVDFLNRFRYPINAKAERGWDQSAFARLVDQIDWCTDKTLRQHLVQQAEKLLMEEMPVIPLFFINFNYLKNPDLQGVVFSPFGRIDFRWAFWSGSV